MMERPLSPAKLSRPQKRRRRDRRNAVRRAAFATQDLKEQVPFLNSDSRVDETHSLRHPSSAAPDHDALVARVAYMEMMLADIHYAVVGNQCVGAMDYVESVMPSAYALPSTLKPDLPKLRADAPEFCLASGRVARSSNDCAEAPEVAVESVRAASSSTVLDSACRKCCESLDECMCEDVYCRRCLMLLRDCSCADPFFRQRECANCGAREDHASLFDEDVTHMSAPLPDEFCCVECGSKDYDESEHYVVQSAKVCGACCKLGYHEMEWCNDQACETSTMFHRKCMTQLNNRLFCNSCVSRRNGQERTFEDEEDEEENHENKEETEEESDADSIPMSDQPPGGTHDKCSASAPKYWSEEEILIWVQVTIRMLSSRTDPNVLSSHVQQRWKNAKPHIPPDKVARMQTMLEEKNNTALKENY